MRPLALLLAGVLLGCQAPAEPEAPRSWRYSIMAETQTLTYRPTADGTLVWVPSPGNSFPWKAGIQAWEYVETADGGYLFDPGAASFKIQADPVPPQAKILAVVSRYNASHGGDRDIFPESFLVPGLVIDGQVYTGAQVTVPSSGLPAPSWIEVPWPTNPATGNAWKAVDLQGERVEPYFGITGPGTPLTTISVDALELQLQIEIRGPRESILEFISTLLRDPGRPIGVPEAVRSPGQASPASSLPEIAFWPVRDKVLPAHGEAEGAEPGTAPAELVRRILDVAVRVTASTVGGSPPDAELDPLATWVEQTLVSADWPSIGATSATKVAEDFDQAVRNKAVASSTGLYRIYYSTRAGDASVPY